MTFGFQCDDETSFAIMDAAFEAGMTFFDTADVYPLGGPFELVGRTEELIGEWMQRGDRRRDDIVLATKCFGRSGPHRWDQGNSRKNVMRAIDASLRRLRTDYVDLYQIHFYDRNTPIDETLRAMDDLVRSGKVRYLGCSNTLAYQLARAIGRSELHGIARFESVQPRYNLLFRENERELFPLCDEEHVAVIPYNPLAGGLLTGKHTGGRALEAGDIRSTPPAWLPGFSADGGADPEWLGRVEALREILTAGGRTLAQGALAWIWARSPLTVPIPGFRSVAQAEENAGALAKGPLTEDQLAEIDRVLGR